MKPHLFLNNPRGEQRNFNAGRNFDPEEVPEREPAAYRRQKARLRESTALYSSALERRIRERTLEVPRHLEYIKVHFYIVFNNNEPFKTKSRFSGQFGLVPVSYYNFNQSVLFAIKDRTKVDTFFALLEQFYSSRDTVSPQGTPYAIMTVIHDFELLETASIIDGAPGEEVILSLVRPTDSIRPTFNEIYRSLRDYLRQLPGLDGDRNVQTDGISTMEIGPILPEAVTAIAANFDIIYRIQSLRIPAIGASAFGQPELRWDLHIDPPPDASVTIGVLDNGVRPIAPLEDILVDFRLDLTSPGRPNALSARHPHGTIVATLAASGMGFFDKTRTRLPADAYILPIKILKSEEGYFNIYRICEVIRSAADRGVRIFNLSVTGPGKLYNAPVSEYAYLLDQLAWERDILIFIATGNLPFDDIEAMQSPAARGNALHGYPNHFYNPNKHSSEHVCEATNLCLPAESHNNITVGAIAENLEPRSALGLTALKELPAYYTRKWHLDYAQKVNGTDFSLKQINYNLNKPDIVMPGGDLLTPLSRMQVIGFGERGTDFYTLDSGTSYAAPLAANLAAKIVRQYPALTMQSVKALILNSSEQPLTSEFLDGLVADIREELAEERFSKAYDDLTQGDKKQIRLSSDMLYRRLVGYGMPQVEAALFSHSKAVTLLIQDTISVDSHKVINLNLPKYLLKYSKPSYILQLKATLSYKFSPVWNNQLCYNPLHISFNFVRSLKKNNPAETANILSDRDHPFNKQLAKEADSPEAAVKARQEAYGIKQKIHSWSEDFFPPATKPFANTQQLEINITKEEMQKIGNQLSIAVRCTCKKELGRDVLDPLLQSPHPFSIAVTVREKKNKELGRFDLYDELEAINDLEAIGELEAEDDLEAEGEEE